MVLPTKSLMQACVRARLSVVVCLLPWHGDGTLLKIVPCCTDSDNIRSSLLCSELQGDQHVRINVHTLSTSALQDAKDGVDVSRHFSYYAWEGGAGSLRWKHEVWQHTVSSISSSSPATSVRVLTAPLPTGDTKIN